MQSISRRHALDGLAAAAVAAAVPALASAQDNDPKAIYSRFIDEVINGGNFDAVDELVSPDFAPQLADPGDLPGRDALKQRLATQRSQREGMGIVATCIIDEVIGEGETVSARQRWSGMMGGQQQDILVLTFVTMRDGQIAALWNLSGDPVPAV
jgi:hypothetical protein